MGITKGALNAITKGGAVRSGKLFTLEIAFNPRGDYLEIPFCAQKSPQPFTKALYL
jgi:hypothetical protein